MESTIRVFCTPTQMLKAFGSEKISIRHFVFLGVETEGDVNASEFTEEEWNTYKGKTCLYMCRIRHEEFSSRLRSEKPYKSWGEVHRALDTRRKRRDLQ